MCSSGYQGTDNTSKICLSNTSSDLSLSNQADGPSVIPLKNDRGLETAIIVILVIVLILIVALCFIFVQCRRTKRGPEIGIRFSSLAFGVGHSAANSNDWDQDQQHVTVDKTGTGVGFSNPRFQSGASQNFQWKNSEVWPDSPDIDRDSPAILGGHSTPLVAMRDTDSAFQEPSLVRHVLLEFQLNFLFNTIFEQMTKNAHNYIKNLRLHLIPILISLLLGDIMNFFYPTEDLICRLVTILIISFQASSYDEDENQHLSVTSYKDKHRLLD